MAFEHYSVPNTTEEAAYNLTFLCVYWCLFVVACIAVYNASRETDCRFSARVVSFILTSIFALLRGIEFSFRVGGRHEIVFEGDEIRGGVVAAGLLLFVIPLALIFSTFSTLLMFWLRVISIPTHQYGDKTRRRVRSLLVVSNVVVYFGFAGLVIISGLLPSRRWEIVAVTNLFVALMLCGLICALSITSYRLAGTAAALDDAHALPTQSRLRWIISNLRAYFQFTAIGAMAMIIYAFLLLRDAVWLLATKGFPTGNYDYTNPIGVLVLFRLAEVIPPVGGLITLRSSKAGYKEIRS